MLTITKIRSAAFHTQVSAHVTARNKGLELAGLAMHELVGNHRMALSLIAASPELQALTKTAHLDRNPAWPYMWYT